MRTLIFVTLALVLLSSRAASQTVSEDAEASSRGLWLIGTIGGFNINSYNTDYFPILVWEKLDGLGVQNGSGTAFWAGLRVEHSFDAELNHSFLSFEALFDSKSADFSAFWNLTNAAQTTKNGVDYLGSKTSSARAQLNYLLFNLLYRRNFQTAADPTGPGIEAGLSVGIPLPSKIIKTVTVNTSSGDAANPESSSTWDTQQEIYGLASFRLALRGALTYDVPISSTLNIHVVLGYDLPITKVNVDYNWKASSTYAGLSIRYVIHE